MVVKKKTRGIREIEKKLEDLGFQGLIRLLEGRGTKRIEGEVAKLREELKARKKKARKKSRSAY